MNTDQGRLISIEQLVVFGSYLDPTADRLGDLDIAATLTHWPQHADPKDWNRRCEDHLHASGRSFSSLVDRLCWPVDEAKMMLRNPSQPSTSPPKTSATSPPDVPRSTPGVPRLSETPPKIASKATLADLAITAS